MLFTFLSVYNSVLTFSSGSATTWTGLVSVALVVVLLSVFAATA